jgi:hypothetical protein
MDAAWLRRAMCESALRCELSTARLLARRVRIPLEACLFVCCECCVLSCKGLCLEPITPPGESYRVIEESHRGGLGPLGLSSHERQRQTDGQSASFCCERTNEGSSLYFDCTVWQIIDCYMIIYHVWSWSTQLLRTTLGLPFRVC